MSKKIIAREFKKKTFIQTGVKKTLDGWAAYFTIGNQSFTLTDTDSKESALMFEKMLHVALGRYGVDLLTYYRTTATKSLSYKGDNFGLRPEVIVSKYIKKRKRDEV